MENHRSICCMFFTFCFLFDCFYSMVSENSIYINFTASNMDYVDYDGVFLTSKNGTFSLAFLNPGEETNYYLCVQHVASQTIVWTANRDFPVSESDQLIFSKDGNAVVITNNTVVWSTNTKGQDVQRMQLRDSGNLAFLDSKNATVWQSFDHPTDTLLFGQILAQGMQLVSSFSATDFSSGAYHLSMQSQGLILFLNYSPPQIYWSMAKDSRTTKLSNLGAPAYALLDKDGLIVARNDSTAILQISQVSTSIMRAYLDPNGDLQLFTFVSGIWSSLFKAIEDECSFPLACGPFGICSDSGQCSCPGSLLPLNSSNLAQGCEINLQSSCSNSSTMHLYEAGSGLNYFANKYSYPIITAGLEACQQLCMQNCSCRSVSFYMESNFCFLLSQLGTFQHVDSQDHVVYLKMDSINTIQELTHHANNGPPPFVVPAIIGSASFIILLLVCSFAWWFLHTRQKLNSREEILEDEQFINSIPGLPARYSYKQLQIATSFFSKKLGSGGFGSVYEGVLPDKSRIAVKQLESVGQGKKEFRAEVAVIGNIHHIHLAQLRGFCAEGMHRLLVYEHMANGSLDNVLFKNAGQKEVNLLDWNTRYNIALGTAKGLAYLHNDCREKIIHCDIKPENILLDENYVAKVSDFGLAKFINKEQSQVFTSLRGTRGYLAPEWLTNLTLSDKTDVYSFGMVLLEIVSGHKNFDSSQTSGKWYFPAFAFQLAENGDIEELLDPKVKATADIEQVIRVVRIALWCIQEEADIRPSMARVVQMLEGTLPVPEAPLSSQFVVRLHSRMVEAMNASEQSSIASPYESQGLHSATYLSEPR